MDSGGRGMNPVTFSNDYHKSSDRILSKPGIKPTFWTRPIFFTRIEDSHCEEYCAEHWLKEVKESMNRCTGHHNITEILLKMVFNTIYCADDNLLLYSGFFCLSLKTT